MGVSENRGTPKSSILIGFSIINHLFWGTPIFGNTHIPYSSPKSSPALLLFCLIKVKTLNNALAKTDWEEAVFIRKKCQQQKLNHESVRVRESAEHDPTIS